MHILRHSGPCWAVKGEDTVCASKDCRNCSVYQDYGECGSIKNFIRNKLTELIMNSLSRRRFLKISGATIATAAVLAGSAKTFVNAC
ncbi:MAG: twin-arginine translocation signal domain-containing protein [Ignavibacteriales bacterium]|nr:twin-arginine translocation signal domain-containing protein [Ignavibacteriales bacterium]